MAVSFLNALKKSLDNVESGGRRGNENLWRAPINKDGSDCDSKVRILPYRHAEDGNPFREMYFYFNIGRQLRIPNLVAPFETYGIPNPMYDFVEDVRREDFSLFRKLQPGPRFYVPIVVVGEEDKGVKWWGFGKDVFKDIVNTLLKNEDFEDVDVTDPLEGRELLITTSKSSGAQFYKTKVQFRSKSTPLASKGRGPDEAAIQKILDSIPRVEDVFPAMSNDELEKLLVTLREKADAGAFFEEGGESRGGDKEKSSKEEDVDEAAAKVSKASEPDSDDSGEMDELAGEFEDLLNS